VKAGGVPLGIRQSRAAYLVRHKIADPLAFFWRTGLVNSHIPEKSVSFLSPSLHVGTGDIAQPDDVVNMLEGRECRVGSHRATCTRAGRSATRSLIETCRAMLLIFSDH
jgi:hypothetical protein